MRLKRLEIQGFKSFPDRTVFKFQQDGMTAVVGPNGCGKSNIVDAVRWALGEQSAKLLRGQLMDDVIFNGSDRRKPAGMAQVTLVFENDGTLENQWRDYAEISVSRQLFRTGESEYLINGVSCRLKEVRELIADAGGSSRGYSIVEQGRISLLVNSRPEEKRALMEEAAGVLKYRMRRLEAERKMERTRQNLLRVTDVIREVQRQVNSMKRSAAKARRYRILRNELTSLDLRLRFEDYSTIALTLDEEEKKLAERRSRLGDLEGELAVLEAGEETLRGELTAGEGKITDGFEKVRATEGEIARLEGDISIRENAIRSLEERIQALGQDEEELSRRTESDRKEREQLELELVAIEDEHGRISQDLEEAQDHFGSAEKTLSEARSQMDTARSRLFALASELGKVGMELDSSRRAREGLGRRRSDSDRRLANLESRTADLEKDRKVREVESRRAEEAFRGATAELSRTRVEIQTSQSAVSEANAALASLAEKQAEIRGLLRTLVAMEEQMEGLPDGVRHVMRNYAEAGQAGILGVVADYIDVPQKYEKAVLAVLGERLGHVIVDGPDSGRSAVDYLKEKAAGRGSFIPKSPRANGNGKGNGNAGKDGEPGVIGSLVDLVRFSSDLNGVGDFLLGDVLLVEDLRRAVDLWRQNGITATLVTLDGDVVEATGIITGGSQEADETPLARKRKIRELNREAEKVQADLDQTRGTRDELRERIAEQEKSLEELEIRCREMERVLLGSQSSLTMVSKELEQLGGSLEDLRSEVALAEREERDLEETMDRCQRKMRQLEAEEKTCREEVTLLEERLSRLGGEVEEKRASLEEVRIRVNSTGLRRENSQRALRSAEDRHREMEERGARITREREEAVSRIQTNLQEISSGREAVRVKLGELEESREALRILREEQEGKRVQAEGLAARARELRQRQGALREEASAMDIRIHELRAERQHVKDRVQEEHRKDIAQLSRDQFSDEPFERGSVEERIGFLREKIAGMGEVNAGAVEEFEELNARYEFLTSQKADLEASMDSLQKAIRKINRTSRERFLATFREVSENFSTLFPRLFDGGEAKMVLLDENDPLNTGVDIEVRLPGKRLKSMQLLSGGEKALVSLTMILSMFLAKPSPVCILDEVDAPLDDKNLGNFASIIREMSRNYQFLIITHNKLTMETADVLYGITMREPGASQVVSVRLKDVA